MLLQVDFPVSHAAPEPLSEHVVHPPASPILADGNARFREPSGPFLRGELAALIGVEDSGLGPGQGQRFPQSDQARPAKNQWYSVV